MKIVSWIPLIEMAEVIYFYTITYLDDPTLFISGKSNGPDHWEREKPKQEQMNLSFESWIFFFLSQQLYL